MRLRVMTVADISAGMRLKDIAGWNQSEQDWKRFLHASPSGCFVAEENGEVCGTATTIIYENRFAWIAMVLVDPQFRSRGFGTQLLQQTIKYLDDVRIPTIKLDATPEGKPIYEKLGFICEYELERWTLRSNPANSTACADERSFESVAPKLLASILKQDEENFGADRAFLLTDLHQNAPQFTIAIERKGMPQAYCFGRRGSFADHLGPWIASDSDSALRILETFLARSTRDTVIVDRLESSAFTEALLRSAGFTFSRPLTRMVRGPNKYPGQPDRVCAVLGPEFG